MRYARHLIFVGLLVAIIVLFSGCNQQVGEPVIINGIEAPPVPTLDALRVSEGGLLYQQYCAGCHGSELEGAPDWKIRLPDGSFPSPPHDSSGHTWHHPDNVLMNIIAKGGDPAYGGTMPGFGEQLTEAEMVSILDFFKSKWGKEEREFQWWVSAQGR